MPFLESKEEARWRIMVMRDNKGVVVLHSRKAFDSSVMEEEFKLDVSVWAVESIKKSPVGESDFCFSR